mmetsp:Transcript_5354/g.14408  ORF Transcript_5354/g.14408 Transcript_5354/m.14408 type:complete len:429 (+) Transcript_5354:173-1459(+)
MGRSTPRRALTAVEQLRLRYKPSPLTGPHALARRAVNKPEELKGALQLLKDNFLSQQTWQSAADQRRAAIAAQSSHGNLIVPNPRYSKLPVHVLANDKPQPWQLLPMRAAALKHYPDFFGQSSLFFSSLHGAVLKGAANQLLRPSKLMLDLAKVMRNLGIISNFEIIQRISKCRAGDYIWPAGQEPEHHLDLALYPYLYLRLDLRWDAHRPVWLAGGASHFSAPMHTHEPLPFSVEIVSRPSKPVIMSPNEVRHAAARWPTGVLFMYHPSHGIITDIEAEQHGVPALAMAHIGLPWAQVAQIRGLLRAKVEREAKQPKHQAVPLQDWSLVDHVRQTLEERASLLPSSSLAVQSQCEALEREAKGERQAGEELARRARQDGSRLMEELIALKLAPKLGQSSSLAAAVATPPMGGSRGETSSRGGGGGGR